MVPYSVAWIFVIMNGAWLALFILPLAVAPIYYWEASILEKLCGDDPEKICERLEILFTIGKVTGVILLLVDFAFAIYSTPWG